MNRITIYSMLLLVFSFVSCQQVQSQDRLSAQDFAEKLNSTTDKQVVDVRTPGEFEGGYIRSAVNIDWEGSDFDAQVGKLDKSKPTFVYCLSGGRSAAAAAHMREMGFKQVYEMNGGLLKWRAAGLPEVGSPSQPKGMTVQDFNAMLQKDKPVLVDIYAPWCEPCKKMAPYLDALSKEQAETLIIIRINADENPGLLNSLKVEGLPNLRYYKQGNLVWQNTGFISKENLLPHLK